MLRKLLKMDYKFSITSSKRLFRILLLIGMPTLLLLGHSQMVASQMVASNIIRSANSTNITSSVFVTPKINQLVRSLATTTLSGAIARAEGAVGQNPLVESANLIIQNGFLLYDITADDANNVLHRVLVDPGNGKILLNQPLSPTLSTTSTNKKSLLNPTAIETGCFIHPCPFVTESLVHHLTNATTPATKNVTALAGISFRNMSLPQIITHKNELKASLSKYINSTIDDLASGRIRTTFTNCVPVDGKRCPIITGIIIPPGNLP